MALGDGSRGRLRGEWGEEETQRVIEFGAFPRLIPGTFRLEREPDGECAGRPVRGNVRLVRGLAATRGACGGGGGSGRARPDGRVTVGRHAPRRRPADCSRPLGLGVRRSSRRSGRKAGAGGAAGLDCAPHAPPRDARLPPGVGTNGWTLQRKQSWFLALGKAVPGDFRAPGRLCARLPGTWGGLSRVHAGGRRGLRG